MSENRSKFRGWRLLAFAFVVMYGWTSFMQHWSTGYFLENEITYAGYTLVASVILVTRLYGKHSFYLLVLSTCMVFDQLVCLLFFDGLVRFYLAYNMLSFFIAGAIYKDTNFSRSNFLSKFVSSKQTVILSFATAMILIGMGIYNHVNRNGWPLD